MTNLREAAHTEARAAIRKFAIANDDELMAYLQCISAACSHASALRIDLEELLMTHDLWEPELPGDTK